MNNNSLGKVFDMMREEGSYYNETPVMIGEVREIPPKLKIITNKEMILDEEDILFSKWILDLNEKLGYTCNINLCKGTGIIGSLEHEGKLDIKCVSYNSCSKSCNKTGIQFEENESDCKNCKVDCKSEIYFEDRLKKGDKVILVKYDDKFIITEKVVSLE